MRGPKTQIWLEIKDADSLISMIEEARSKAGLFKNFRMEVVRQLAAKRTFPLRIPVDTDGILDLASNPILKKMFGRKLEETTKRFLVSEKG